MELTQPAPAKLTLRERLAAAPWLEPLLGAMVAIFGLLTAYAAYDAGIYGGNSSEHYFVGLSDLSDANYFYSQGNQDFVEDSNLLTQMEVQAILIDDEARLAAVEEALYSNLSISAQDAIDPESGDFDQEAYFAALYGPAETLTDNSDRAFAAASAWDQLGDQYELLVLLLALGLGFAAWAGLMRPEGWTRYIFAGLGSILLVVCIGYTVVMEMQPRPETVVSCWNDEACSLVLSGVEEPE